MNLLAIFTYLTTNWVRFVSLNPQLLVNTDDDSLITWQESMILGGKKIYSVLEPLALAVATGFLFNWLKVPVAWLMGPLVLGIVYAFIQGTPKPLPSNFITVGKALIGVSSAARFSPETLSLAQHYTIPLLLCIITTAALSMFNGYLLSKWTGIDKISSFLGSIPGSASSVVAMSEELGADAASVAVLQYLRMMLVLLIVPAIATFLAPNLDHANNTYLLPTNLSVHTVPTSVNLLALAGCCSLGIILGKWLNLPTSGFLGSFLLAITLFWSFPHQFYVPRILFIIGLILVALSTGLKFDWQTIHRLWKAVLIKSFLVVILVFCCLGIGYEFHLITHVDTITSLLAFTPGAVEAMIATVTQLGGDTGTVLAIQMTRQLLILLAINLLHWFSKSVKNPAKSQLIN
ncbi:AbrB family transcriptional regulator [Aphanothece sacrum]|uniref:AbrB family transcriptional regulator n=1 Tax=Aphanothece sacrum FPU1 TaxID=1920663 RepID=A0A401IMA9_APHSA|nr:AbrB family transcriptional regulator [Aphanothece sacrum]GBF82387.1 AbrB family transcriptional regulator [Aphanothece sacrum FPU1]GBF84288.1 AbrB family transcriptional regulator [Aphanothece sacrum FPU3]